MKKLAYRYEHCNVGVRMGYLKQISDPWQSVLNQRINSRKQECKEILELVNQPEFQSLPPSQIVPILADQGIYIASESTFYRDMYQAGEQNHRGRCKAPSSKPKSTITIVVSNSLSHTNVTEARVKRYLRSGTNSKEAAKACHSERWTRQTRNWSLPDEVWLNPEKSQAEDQVESKTDAS